MTVSGRIRVVLCDDVPALRRLVRIALEDEPDFEVVGEAEDGQQGVDRCGETLPDVVLLDLSMPVLDGLEAIPLIAERSPDTGIIVFSGFAGDRMARVALELGADRYLEKGEQFERVREVVREVAADRAARAAAL